MNNSNPTEREALIKKLVDSYMKVDLEVLLREPVIKEQGLQDELKQQIQRRYCPQMVSAFSLAQEVYSRINGANDQKFSPASPVNNTKLSPPEIIQRYKDLRYNLHNMDQLFQRLHEDFHLETILVPVKQEGKEGEKGKRENLAEILPACLYSLGMKVNESYLDFLVRTSAQNNPEYLATDNFDKKYQELLTAINYYKTRVHLSEQEEEDHQNTVERIQFNCQRAIERLRPIINQQSHDLRELCVLQYAHKDHFLNSHRLFQDGDKLFDHLFRQYCQYSLLYGKLLGGNERKLRKEYEEIKSEALQLRAMMLPKI